MGETLTEIKRPIQMMDNEEYALITVKRRNEGIVLRGKFQGKEILVKNYFKIKAGDFLISKRQVVHGATGIVPQSLDGSIVSNEYLVSTDNEITTADFLSLISKRPEMYKNFFLSSYGIDIEKLVFDVEDWKKRTANIPLIREQTSICTFFRTLDAAITLHQRKLEALRELKKGYLQQMFPQAGERVPRVRFVGFSGEWEERRLGDLAEFSKGNGYSKTDLTNVGTPIILYGRLYTNYETTIHDVDTFTDPKAQSVVSRGGEVIVPSSGETPEDIARASVVEQRGIILGGDLNIITVFTTISPVFLAITITNGRQQEELSKRAQGKSVVHLNNSDLKEVILQFPDISEQAVIGEYFHELDKQIAALSTKIERLRQLKVAYLQKMFV